MVRKRKYKDWIVYIILFVLIFAVTLILGRTTGDHPETDNNNSLLIPVELIFRNASYVNQLLKERGIQNVRVLTQEEFGERLRNYSQRFNISWHER